MKEANDSDGILRGIFRFSLRMEPFSDHNLSVRLVLRSSKLGL